MNIERAAEFIDLAVKEIWVSGTDNIPTEIIYPGAIYKDYKEIEYIEL